MKISLSWLNTIVDLKGLHAEEIGEKLTLHTAEVEELIDGKGGDTLIDIDNKSLTHRPDLMGHRGFARELSAIFQRKRLPGTPPPSAGTDQEKVEVKIESEKCRRFCAVKLSNIKIKPASNEDQVMLENLGTKVINNIVDITNLVMFECGQPMHAFDAAKVEGVIHVRNAKKGEKILALDGEEYELCEDDLVIADDKKAISIAGIMGGEETGISESTTEVIFECANFDPVSVRKTSARLGLRSESSMRFEKSLDAEQCIPALEAALSKTLASCPDAQIVSRITDEYPQKSTPASITIPTERVRQLGGLDISDQDMIKHLESIDFEVKQNNDELEVQIPTFRATKDVSIPEDIVEEVVRLHGFYRIPEQLPSLPITAPPVNHMRNLEWEIRDFCAGNGYNEVKNYNFVREDDRTFTESEEYVEVQNPLSEEHTHLRRTLVSNFVRHLEAELKDHQSLSFFELGKTFIPVGEVLPKEETHATLFQAHIRGDEDQIFYDVKSHLEELFTTLHIAVSFEKSAAPSPFAHPSKSADIIIGNEKIGTLAVLHPGKKPFDEASIVFAEMNMESVLPHFENRTIEYQRLSPFPAVRRDLSLVMDRKITMGSLVSEAQKASPLLKSMELFDEFQDEKRFKGKKNIAFHLTFQSHEKTLEESDIEQAVASVVSALQKGFQTQLRLDFDAQNG